MDSFSDFWAQYGDVFGSAGIALLIFAAFWILSKLLYHKIIPLFLKKAIQKEYAVAEELLTGFRQPLAVYFKFMGLCLALLFFTDGLLDETLPRAFSAMVAATPGFLTLALRIGTVVVAAWGFIKSSGITALLMRNARHKLDLHTSKSVNHFLVAVFNVLVIIIAVVIILNELNFDINGLITGLGIGGLTIALAAQDSASNFFGGLVLVVEKPFEIGESVTCSGVEGTVEDISLRSTKIRTNDGALTVVPNSMLSAGTITNWSSEMKKRRADFTLGVVYDTTKQQLQDFISAARDTLLHDPQVLDDGIVVRFSDYGESSLNIRFIFYTALPGFADHLTIKERVNYALMDLAAEYGIDFAFPTRTLYLDKPDEPSDAESL